MKKIAQILAVLMMAAVALKPVMAQDYMIRQNVHTDEFSIMGQTEPASDVVQTLWFTQDAVVSVDDKSNSIINFKTKAMTIINHEQKTYMEVPLNFDLAVAAGEEGEEETQGMAALMQGMMKTEVSVESTGNSKKVGQWNASEYILTIKTMMGPLTQTLWASTETPIDEKAYRNFVTASMAAIPGMAQKLKDIAKEMEKVKGAVVASDFKMTIMGATMHSTSEVIEIKKGKIPAELMTIPAGYSEQQGMGM